MRSENQDHVHVDAAAGLFCVADGMGGVAEGARASEMACAALRRACLSFAVGLTSRREAVSAAIRQANADIFAYSASHRLGQMGTTVALVVVDPDDPSAVAVCHVGDSRVYRVRRGTSQVLTRDHSLGFALADTAGSSAEELRDRSNPYAHVLTRALGVQPSVEDEWRLVDDVRVRDRFLICSDGVHDVVSDARIGVFVGGGSLASAAERLEGEVVRCGAPDNYSFIILEFA